MDQEGLLICALGTVFCAFLNRMRGGGFFEEASRVSAAVGFAVWMFLVTDNLLLAPVLGAQYLLGASWGWTKWINTIPGHLTQGQYNLEWAGRRNPRTDNGFDVFMADILVGPTEEIQNYRLYVWVGMTIRGLMWWFPPAVGYVYFGHFGAAAACFALAPLFPFSYWAAGRFGVSAKYLKHAEYAYGAIYGALLTSSLLT